VTLTERHVGDVTVMDIQGRIAIQDGSDILRQAIERAVAQGRLKVLINFHDTPYIDSTALGEIIRGYTTLKRKGGSIKLYNLTRPIHDLLTITNLVTIFETFDNEAAALASFAAPARR
jgi:anti-sigma B factor antagonist